MIKITNIVWDTEVDGEVVPQDELDLPSEVEISEDDLIESYGIDDDENVEDYIADYLSDEYEYCVKSFTVE